MKAKVSCIVSVCIASLFFASSCSDDSTTANSNPQVEMNVTYAIIPVESDGVMNLAYHVSLSNYAEKALTLNKVDVIDSINGRVIASYSGSTLADIMIGPTIPPPTPQELIDGTKKLSHPYLCIWLRMKKSEVPQSIKHILTFTGPLGTDVIIEGAPATIQNTEPVVIGAPFRGEGWFCIETTSPKTHHFKCEATKDKVTMNAERFAVDWLQYDSNNKLFSGDGTKNVNFVCYGKELIAVADGVVTAVHDNVLENDVGMIRALKWEDMAGNYVSLRIGNGSYAVYCHMIPRSIRVAVGQTVKKGDVLGLLGNSGNSDCPHLHFQICDSNSFYAADGLPYVFDSLTVAGYSPLTPAGDNYVYTPLPAPVLHRYELMENYAVLSFP